MGKKLLRPTQLLKKDILEKKILTFIFTETGNYETNVIELVLKLAWELLCSFVVNIYYSRLHRRTILLT